MDGISPNITKVISVDSTPILTAEEIGSWLNLSSGMVTKVEDILNDLIKTTTEVVEKYTWLALRPTVYEANYELDYSSFLGVVGGNLRLTLERSPILATGNIDTIEYLDSDGVYQEFDKGALAAAGLYENVTEKLEQRQWASVYFREPVPYDNRINSYKIRITFTAGFTTGLPSPLITDVPAAIKLAMKMIVADYYTNRGDCGGACNLNGFPVPCSAKAILDLWSIARTVLGGSYNPRPSGGGVLC